MRWLAGRFYGRSRRNACSRRVRSAAAKIYASRIYKTSRSSRVRRIGSELVRTVHGRRHLTTFCSSLVALSRPDVPSPTASGCRAPGCRSHAFSVPRASPCGARRRDERRPAAARPQRPARAPPQRRPCDMLSTPKPFSRCPRRNPLSHCPRRNPAGAVHAETSLALSTPKPPRCPRRNLPRAVHAETSFALSTPKPCRQCWGWPARALVARRMSRTLATPKRRNVAHREGKAGRRGDSSNVSCGLTAAAAPRAPAWTTCGCLQVC